MASFFETCIRRPVLATVMSIVLILFGVLGLRELPVRELPDIDAPIVNVLTVYPGASAEVVETEVTERLEEAVSSTEGIHLLTSTSREGTSSIVVEFEQGIDIDIAAQDVRDRVSRVRGDLPDDIEEPVISKQDASARPIIWIAFFSDRFNTQELTQIADDLVVDRLQSASGVSSVILGGEKKYAVRLRLDAHLMAAHGVTVSDVENALNERNVELPSGRVEGADRELTIQTQGELPDAEAFNDMVILREGDRLVRLGDIGLAEDGVEDERSIARYNSRPSVGLGIVRQSNANTLNVAEAVKARMDEIAPSLPEGIEYAFPYDQSIYVGNAVNEVFETLFIAFGLVVLAIFMFLRNIRSTIIPTLAVPISIIATFGVLNALGYSINIFTLLALVLAIGIVVDDAIIVLENVYRHIEAGDSPYQAAIKSTHEIAFAVVTTTVSLAAVFLPLTLLGGLSGRLLVEFAVALSAAVICSSFVALTLSPMACSRLLKPISEIRHGKLFNFFERILNAINHRYDRSLAWALRHRFAMFMVASAIFAISVGFFFLLDKEFLPEEDKGRFVTVMITPQGSTPEYTDRMVRQAEEIISSRPEVEGYFSAVALPFEGTGNASQAFMFTRLTDENRPNVRDIVGGPTGVGARLFGEVEGAISFVLPEKAVSTGFGQAFQLVLKHPDLDTLYAVSQQVSGALWQSGFLTNVRPTFELNKPEVRVKIDRERAAALGVSIREIARTLQVLFGGEDLSEIKRDGKQYEVMAQLERDARNRPEKLDGVYVHSDTGELIQLSNLVTLETGAGPNQIERFARERSVSIEAEPVGVTLGTALEKTEALLPEILPAGVKFDWAGEARDMRESSADLYFFALIAFIVVFLVLAAQFESFVHPITVMSALPLAALGGLGLLVVLSFVNDLGQMLYAAANYAPDPPGWLVFIQSFVPRIPAMNLNIFSQVGFILLIGLVTKNAILLVEFANQRTAAGESPKDAMLEAGRIRLRPILMTSLATVMGILPIAIGFGEAAESRRPLGVVVVGGMITSTLLTLYIVPVIYTLLGDLVNWFSRNKKAKHTA